MRHKRKLIPRQLFKRLYKLHSLGVPVAKLSRNINISHPHLTKLIANYTPELEASYFPDWLDDTRPDAQEMPDGWRYIGRFPLGEWEHCTLQTRSKAV